ncbi:hypothetical protein SERLA73DRAFT_24498, partial [Serpula lacrymans var. lacrymans S7.3]
PHCNIHIAITSDVLHHLYQGILKHMVHWCQQLLDPKELDARIRALHPCFGVCYFKNGFFALDWIGGNEKKDMAKILLGRLIGKLPCHTTITYQSLLDFIQIAQYPTHGDTTLGYIAQSLNIFHQHKDILIRLGVRDHFNIPKFFSLLHYQGFITWLGTTNNYNTEMFERFHIDFAKDGWRASNKRNEAPQMITWLLCREKIFTFESYL